VLVQVLEGVAPALTWDVAVALELALDAGEVVGLGLTLALGLELVLPVSVGVALPVAVVVLLALAVLVLVEGAVLLVSVAVVELTCVTDPAELAVDDEHGATAAGLLVPPDRWLADASLADPWPTPLVLVDPLVVLGEPASPTDWNIGWRIDGTTASIKPTANTAKPTAKAGRSMASRQSRGRCACRGRSGLVR
jgi:hypothetical protein